MERGGANEVAQQSHWYTADSMTGTIFRCESLHEWLLESLSLPLVLPLSIRQALLVSHLDDITFPEHPIPSQSRFVDPNLHPQQQRL